VTPGRERMAQLRWRRRQQDVRQVTVWLDQASVDRLAALRRPGEHDSDVVRRALEVLEAQEASGRPRVTSDPIPDPAAVTSDITPEFKRIVTSDTSAPAPPSRSVTSDTEPPSPPEEPDAVPEVPAKDAPLVALLRQTPLLPYAAIAARLGISESQVKQKAALWAKAGLIPKRPQGGARPRKAQTAS
jgi:hypothetical protein